MEAAVLIPVLFMLLLLLLQPGIVLYDRTVMCGAAAEACRLLATKTNRADAEDQIYSDSVLRRLGSIPQEEHFHVHDGEACSWEISLAGDEKSGVVSVRIANKLRPLPLVNAGAVLLGLLDEDGCLTVEVSVEASTQPAWASACEEGLDPEKWVTARG